MNSGNINQNSNASLRTNGAVFKRAGNGKVLSNKANACKMNNNFFLANLGGYDVAGGRCGDVYR